MDIRDFPRNSEIHEIEEALKNLLVQNMKHPYSTGATKLAIHDLLALYIEREEWLENDTNT